MRVAYLCASASEYLANPVTPDQVIWRYSGVRPLYDDGASEAKAATRDYVFELDRTASGAPMLSVFGGKITTYHPKLAEQALERVASFFPDRPDVRTTWTSTASLPGGDFSRPASMNWSRPCIMITRFLTTEDARSFRPCLWHAGMGHSPGPRRGEKTLGAGSARP